MTSGIVNNVVIHGSDGSGGQSSSFFSFNRPVNQVQQFPGGFSSPFQFTNFQSFQGLGQPTSSRFPVGARPAPQTFFQDSPSPPPQQGRSQRALKDHSGSSSSGSSASKRTSSKKSKSGKAAAAFKFPDAEFGGWGPLKHHKHRADRRMSNYVHIHRQYWTKKPWS